MKSRKNRASLKHALDLCDRLCLLKPGDEGSRDKESGRDPDEPEGSALSTRREILSYLRTRPLPGCLGAMGRKHRLSPREMVILLVLLRGRVVDGQSTVKGRELLSTLFDSTFQLLKGAELLAPDSSLRRSAAVVSSSDTVPDVDLLDQDFRLSDQLYEELFREIHNRPEVGADSGGRVLAGYQGNLELLMDLRRLSMLYQRRAGRAFQIDYWQEGEVRPEESIEALNREIERLNDHIAETLGGTEGAPSYPMLRFQAKYDLDEKELVIAVTLLFQEFLYGHSYLEAVELIKLVSADEAELVQNRKILDRESRLVRSDIVIIEEPVADKEFVTEAHLSDWALEFMIAEPRKKGMDGTARRNFQRYLHGLKDSGDFYKNLRRRRG